MHWPFCRERFLSGQVTPTGLHMHPNLRWGASPDGMPTTTKSITASRWWGNSALLSPDPPEYKAVRTQWERDEISPTDGCRVTVRAHVRVRGCHSACVRE